MKYNTRLIWDYINGEEVKNIDELESDYKFMLEVLRITNDKNMYNLCSEEMKNNYEFIKSVIEIFIKDKQFVIQIIDEYLQKHNPDEIDYQELIFLVCDITDNINKDIDYDLLKYNLKRTMIYMKERANIEWNLNQEDYKTQQELGMGFAYLLYELYPNSPIILRHFAKRYIDEIFYNQEELTLEEVSRILQIDKEDIVLALDATAAIDSIDRNIGEGDDYTIGDKIASKKDEYEKVVNEIAISNVIDMLEENEKKVIFFRYYREMTQSQTATFLGTSQVQVSRIEKRALKKMHDKLSV